MRVKLAEGVTYQFVPKPRVILPAPMCQYEGPTVSLCSRGDDHHLRRCDHPQADWDNCRRNGAPGQNEQRCAVCDLHSRHEIGTTRHLVYFICPIGRNGIWQKNVEMLLERIDLFNGKRVIAIATGSPIRKPRIRPRQLDAPEQVEAMFAGHGCEFIHVVNKPELGEVVAWKDLFGRVLPGGAGDVTFYAHAKGVGKPTHPAVQRWVELLYSTNLDYWPLVQERLRKYPAVGSFLKRGYAFQGQCRPSRWHFSGSFAWIRNADLASRSWQNALPQEYAGTEAVWGILYRPEEAGCLFHEAFGTVMNLYSVDYWNKVAGPAYGKWVEEHAAQCRIPAAQLV